MAVRCYPCSTRRSSYLAGAQAADQAAHCALPSTAVRHEGIFYAAHAAESSFDGDLPMTEQMTGRKGPAGTERPAGAAAGPTGPSPRDLAARSPHPPAAPPPEPAYPAPAGTGPAAPAPHAGPAPSPP